MGSRTKAQIGITGCVATLHKVATPLIRYSVHRAGLPTASPLLHLWTPGLLVAAFTSSPQHPTEKHRQYSQMTRMIEKTRKLFAYLQERLLEVPAFLFV